MSNSQISEALLLAKFKNGIKLMRPETTSHYVNERIISSVHEVLNFPCNVYFLDKHESRLLCGNESLAASSNATSIKDMLNRNVGDFFNKSSALPVLNNDKLVLFSEKTLIKYEQVEKDDVITQALSFKIPYYDKDNSLLGLLGFGLPKDDLSSQNVCTVVNWFIRDANITSKQEGFNKQLKLSIRETECVFWAANGKTNEEIALILGLSRLTIETYLKNIIRKLNAKNKTHAIAKAIYAKYI